MRAVRHLTVAWLLSGQPAFAVTDFVPPPGVQPARQHFEGRLVLHGEAQGGDFKEYTDDYGVTGANDSPHKHLPEFDFELLQVDQSLVPVRRGAIPGEHPYWEFILEPGRVWQEPDSDYASAALPFSLEEINANCMHNGVLTFRYQTDGRVSRAAYEISSETCAYFKADLWGTLDATYVPQAIIGRDAISRAHRRELASRLPRRSMHDLARDFPGVDPANFAQSGDISPAHLSAWGIVVDGVHYAGNCPTRKDPYHYCEVLDLPSYSLAKSVFAGFALMRLEKLYPGARNKRVADYVPECAAGGNWNDVTFENLLDMASGNYLSAADHGDENAAHSDEKFFSRTQHREKIDYACNTFPRKAAPGTAWVYRTSDIYLLGTAMNALYRQQRGKDADLFRDVLVADIWRPLALSATAETSRRTADQVAQPFTGFGLTLLADDVAKLAAFLNPPGSLAEQLLDREMYRGALQLNSHDRGLIAGDESLRYNNGFWALRVDDLPGCERPQFVPFMSGYGGISVVLLPNGISYYYFSDNYDFKFRRAILEAAKIRGYCQSRPDDSVSQRPIPHE